eukprot:CAMPEP_0117606730 /NCGR_PEP_ID=MMETSP0784-20121206/79859_1 /TAXON_ID=39447 /ORGANISM="" /LENGTH=499 /DNA_ID=CAMNT_0005409813 /DNA_START=135 /DNA_END=1634 /DNA_ORIENTATION=+
MHRPGKTCRHPICFRDNGVEKFTRKHTFHGMTIYPQLVTSPEYDLKKLKRLEWFDVQTHIVTLSTMVYTENIEVFTSVSVEFEVDVAGNLVGSNNLISYRDMINETKTTFVVCLVLATIGAVVGCCLSIWHMVTHRDDCKWGYALYELFSRALLAVFCVIFLVSWSQQIPMAEEFDALFHSFLDIEALDVESIEAAVQQYFDTKTHIWQETSWLKRHRVAAYLVCYVQFLHQMIFYFASHDKMAVLTETVRKGLQDIFHFLAVFCILFFMLAFMAHWMLGEYIPDFGSFGDTISAQGRMIYGEFIYADGASELRGVMVVMYWLYAFTFMIIVFFTLLNFFLAIIVDAFIEVKGDNQELATVHSFPTDLFFVLRTRFLGMYHGWPGPDEVLHFLDEESESQENRTKWLDTIQVEGDDGDGDGDNPGANDGQKKTRSPQSFANKFPVFQDSKRLAEFLYHYTQHNIRLLCRRAATPSPSHSAPNRDDGQTNPDDNESVVAS